MKTKEFIITYQSADGKQIEDGRIMLKDGQYFLSLNHSENWVRYDSLADILTWLNIDIAWALEEGRAISYEISVLD